jgi:glycosyltransferase involved in cell wall biosynthesis
MIDLCVVNYNTKDLLIRLLDSLHEDVNPYNKVWSLYIADNGSKDGTVEWLKENDNRYLVDTVFINQNIGYSAACNQLAGYSNSDIIALLNSDVWFSTEDMVNIDNIFKENPDIHILGPKQRDENSFITHAGIIGSNTQPRHRGWREYDPADVLYKDRVECVTVSGSAYFIRRDVWNALWNNESYRKIYPDATGAFLPTPHYYEETWCSYFARHLGYNVVYDGSVSIGHSWHASSPKPGQGYSEADSKFPISREIFRSACDQIGIERD